MNVDVKNIARGRWKFILPALGIESKFLTKKNGPCPICGGKDRFRFTDHNADGLYYCTHCGPGDGFELSSRVTGKSFVEIKNFIIGMAGKVEPMVEKVDSESCRQAAADRWKRGRLPTPDGTVWKYIQDRVGIWPAAVADIRQLEGNLIARITDAEGKGCNIQTIEMKVDGEKVTRGDKKVMRGTLPKGCAIRLSKYDRVLGIAEGIETALSATQLFGVPCWSVISAVGMSNWIPPEDVKTVVVYGDNDENYTGQAAAYGIAHRLVTQFQKKVEIRIPPRVGWDWNDALKARA